MIHGKKTLVEADTGLPICRISDESPRNIEDSLAAQWIRDSVAGIVG